MLLAIDAGNTNTVFAVLENEEMRGQWRLATNGSRTADEYVVWLKQLMDLDGLKMEDIGATIISTVVPETLFNLQTLCRRFFKSEPLVVGSPGVKLGFDVRILQPGNVGADRLVNTAGAHLAYPGDLIVIDFGTATTFDVVAADGAYEGGIISPGINLSLEALHRAAAQLPLIAITRPQAVVGTDTVSAMKSGVFWGYVAMIEGLVERIKKERGNPDMTVVATGGLASLFRNATDAIQHVDHDLTIRGLREIFRRNQVGAA
ncbi:MAG: type III pantothenate kinase [Alphaproteobacteria bacterium]|nr:MAG: type III pantothenate kinase [Alphaproteobacteria bacterium]